MGLLRTLSNFMRQKFVFAGVPVIIQNSKNEILLGKRDSKSVYYPLYWGLPGGMVDYGEHLENAAVREVKEELGVDIQIIKRSDAIYENLPKPECKLHTIDIPFYAKIISGIPKPKDETSEVKWFKPSEIKNMKLAYSHRDILKGEKLI